MLDQLLKLVEQNAGSSIVNNPDIPNEYNGAAIQHVTDGIFSGLQQQAKSGNLSQLTNMFQSGSSITSNPIVVQLISSVARSVASKFGISSSAAQSMVSSLLPTVMSQLVSKTNNPADNSFDLGDMMKTFTGNNNLDLSSLLGQTTGGKSGGLGGALGKLFD